MEKVYSLTISLSAVEDQYKDLTCLLCTVLNTVNSEILWEFLRIALKDIHVFVVRALDKLAYRLKYENIWQDTHLFKF